MVSYGVAAAALNYFDKALDKLDLHEVAYLAALPKSPLELSSATPDKSGNWAPELGAKTDAGKWLYHSFSRSRCPSGGP